jgi:AraC-like DNA-binding protein
MANLTLGQRTRLQSPSSVVRFSTAEYAPRDRLAAWHEIYGRGMCRQHIEPDDPELIHTDVVFRKLPGLGTMKGYRSPAVYRRERSQVDGDNLFVTVALTGEFEASQLGRSASMKPGDAFVGAGAEPVIARVSPGYNSITVSVPLKAVSAAVPNVDALFGRRIPAENSALRMMTRYLDLFEEVDPEPQVQHQAVSHVYDLLALTLAGVTPVSGGSSLRGARAARLREIKQDIEAQLGSESLSIATIAAHHRLPVRYVQRLFETEGASFTEFVLERRLQRAHRLLRDAKFTDRPIGIIAFEAGFTNQPYFNRAFRQRFGAPPSEIRAQAVSAG